MSKSRDPNEINILIEGHTSKDNTLNTRNLSLSDARALHVATIVAKQLKELSEPDKTTGRAILDRTVTFDYQRLQNRLNVLSDEEYAEKLGFAKDSEIKHCDTISESKNNDTFKEIVEKYGVISTSPQKKVTVKIRGYAYMFPKVFNAGNIVNRRTNICAVRSFVDDKAISLQCADLTSSN
jgi:hypothetical protein